MQWLNYIFTRNLMDGLVISQQRGNPQQLGRCAAPLCWAQRLVLHGFKQTPVPFQKRHLDNLAFANVELNSPMLGFLSRCDARSLFQMLEPNLNHRALG
jgi:hypothetical protein